MHPHLIFWISATVRILVVLGLSAAAGFVWGPVPGLVLAVIGVIVLYPFFLATRLDITFGDNSVTAFTAATTCGGASYYTDTVPSGIVSATVTLGDHVYVGHDVARAGLPEAVDALDQIGRAHV